MADDDDEDDIATCLYIHLIVENTRPLFYLHNLRLPDKMAGDEEQDPRSFVNNIFTGKYDRMKFLNQNEK